MKKLIYVFILCLFFPLHAFGSDGGAQKIVFGPYHDSGGTLYQNIKVEHYAEGTTTDKNCWSEETRGVGTECPTPALDNGGTCDTTSGDGIIDGMYCDGMYKMIVQDSSGVAVYTMDNFKVTADSAGIWESDFGTVNPTCDSDNKWHRFTKVDGSDNFLTLSVCDGSAWSTLIEKDTSGNFIFDNIVADDLITRNTPWIDPNHSDYADLNAAAAACSSQTIVIYDTQALSANLSIPDTCGMVILHGGSITAGGYTLSFAEGSSFRAGDYQVFSGFTSGYPFFGSGTVDKHNIMWWGATGDNATDDITAITSAANSMTTGGTLWVPIGDFLVSSGINLLSGTNLMGAGYGSRIGALDQDWSISSPDNYGVINLDSVNNIRVTNVRITGITGRASGVSPKLIWLYGLTGATQNQIMIDHNWFDTTTWEGIWGGGALLEGETSRIIISDNFFTNVGKDNASGGLPAIQPHGDTVEITNNILYDVGSGIGPTGHKTIISNNIVDTFQNTGISMGDTSTPPIGKTVISNNTIIFSDHSTTSRRGINIVGNTGDVYRVNVTGNTCYLLGDITNTIGTCYLAGTATKQTWSNNVAIIDVFGRGFSAYGLTTSPTYDFTNNRVEMINEGAAASYGFIGIANGAGKTLDVVLSNNHVTGLTRANGSYAYDFNNNSGGTINVYGVNNFADGGNIRIDDANYSTSAFDNTFSNFVSDLTSNSIFLQSPEIGMINLQDLINISIAGGIGTIAGTASSLPLRRTRLTFDTESGAATDDLDTVNGGQTGDIIIISAANGARDVVVKDATGNIQCSGDFTMDNTEDRMMLEYDGSNWIELSRSDNGA